MTKRRIMRPSNAITRKLLRTVLISRPAEVIQREAVWVEQMTSEERERVNTYYLSHCYSIVWDEL